MPNEAAHAQAARMNWLVAFAGIIGAIFGSFIATIVVRWPGGRSVLAGRSACDHCGHALAWHDLVPIVSWLVARGRCRHCGGRISAVHLAIELNCAAIGIAAFALLPVPQACAASVLGLLLVPLGWLDALHLWLPDRLTLALAVGGVWGGRVLHQLAPMDQALGAVAGFGSLWLVALAFRRIRGKDGLGAGDPKLLGALGLWVGWQILPFIVLIAAMTGLIWALLIRVSGRMSEGMIWNWQLPLGTLLAIAGFLVQFGTLSAN